MSVSPAPGLTPELLARAKGLSSATLHEAAGKIGALPSAIKPVDPAMRICGPALPVSGPGGDNLWLHRAIYTARPGDVLLVHVGDRYEHGYWGEVMSTAAQARHLGGLVIDGGVRDGDLLAEIGFPVFSRGLCIRGTGKDQQGRGSIGLPVLFGDVVVQPGDLVVGDRDGVVVTPSAQAAAAIEASHHRDKQELEICEQLRGGATTLDIYGLGPWPT
jgi:4-hydroxy-4-methyl-2-oxoglutarate aldolase